jgi:integrase
MGWTVIELDDKPRKKPLRAIVKNKGHKTLTRHFERGQRKDAADWAQENDRAIRLTGHPLAIDRFRDHTVGEIVGKYLKEKTPKKGSSVTETYVLQRFKDRYGNMSIAAFQEQHAYEYKNTRLGEAWHGPKGNWAKGRPITPRTVYREINSIRRVWTVARKEWGYRGLPNPFAELEIKGSMHRRKRRLEPGEYERLIPACEKCLGLNRYYVPLAIHLAIDTGMRLQEIFNLEWDDIDFEKRRIEIIKSKTDHVSEYVGRTIVLPITAEVLLLHLFHALDQGRIPGVDRPTTIKPEGRIFPLTKDGNDPKDAFEQSWADVRKRAGIGPDKRGEKLEFKDLRREAGSRFDEAGLTKGEHDLMMGHISKDVASIYIHASLQSIQDKLDQFHDKQAKTDSEAIREQLKERLAAKGLIRRPGNNVIPFDTTKKKGAA